MHRLLGPTGSGKSSFVEAIASNPSLGLSSDKLEGFTQSVSIYQVINAVPYNHPLYLVDVPGFADSKISAMSVVSMIKDMIQTSPNLLVFNILYHTPINNPRLPGSQRQVLRTFEALTGSGSAKNITVVSTMWDSICNENSKRRAERNFSQLRGEIWVDYIARGANIVKFYNTPESAFTILDSAYDRSGWYGAFNIHNSINLPLQVTSFAPHIHRDLQTRIQELQMQQANIQLELQTVTEQLDEELKAILVSQLKEVQTLITKFEEELSELGTPADRLAALGPALPTVNPTVPMPGPLLTLEPTASTPESVTPASETHLSASVVVPPAMGPVTSTPDTKLPRDGMLARATNAVKGWGNKLSKRRVTN
ncbi:hypothetical protein BJ165DRAFT_666679 [Panaeolus papilionaceus]|nr:hypothetical protein BJ165DRAFT_666679 [Panaeolus papilionaceus]